MLTWPPAAVGALRRAIAAVDATLRDVYPARAAAGRGDDGTSGGRSAVDLASRLRRLAAELRRAAHGVPGYALLDVPCRLPDRADVDAAVTTLDAMADALLTGHAAAGRDLAVRAAALLELVPEGADEPR